MRPLGERAGAIACALLAVAAPRAAQKPTPLERPPELDPYTSGAAERLTKLGYLRFAPFHFGPAPTRAIDRYLRCI